MGISKGRGGHGENDRFVSVVKFLLCDIVEDF